MRYTRERLSLGLGVEVDQSLPIILQTPEKYHASSLSRRLGP